jgi:alanine-synthesizing transaminase
MFSRRTAWKLAPNRFSQAVEEARASGRPLFDLTISNPTRVGIAYDGHAILSALRNQKSLDYDPQPTGLRAAREAVADYYRERGANVDPENLVLSASTSEGYSHLFRLLANPGDEILVPKPGYPLFEFLADLEDVKLVPFPLLYDHGWQIDGHSLEKSLSEKSRAIVLVHPNNPTGSYVSEQDRARLNDLCTRHQLALIVDEVFLDYAHDGKIRRTFAANHEALTFTLSGLSKISALPQMKLAWIVVSGPGDVARQAMARLEVMGDTFLSVSTPVQHALSEWLAQRNRVQQQLTERVRENLAELDRALATGGSSSRLEVEGGWYAILRVAVTRSDEDLAIALIRECGVLVHPAHFYDFTKDGYLVLSLITQPRVFREGISRILTLFGP